MLKHIKRIIIDLIWVFYNVFVNKIPAAFIRKFLYQIGGAKIGKGSRIGYGTILIYPWKIKIGDNTVINEFCYLDGRGGLTIGNNVSISIYSKILSASHKVNDDHFSYYENGVLIHDFVWIGMSAVILDGSCLSIGSVIGANAVFKGMTQEKGIYVGNPATMIKKRKINSVSISDLSYFK